MGCRWRRRSLLYLQYHVSAPLVPVTGWDCWLGELRSLERLQLTDRMMHTRQCKQRKSCDRNSRFAIAVTALDLSVWFLRALKS
ncbi:hypothetical protein RRG08_043401 [Elysia crispata]|uniref:Uncharacterized protein n=1 Tax=Elysia crispata TaxID=231223 RepID=A0AAE1E5N3_9GAST|nr:hypothetical protein RRG08_043401 [Elysia crispata]